MLKKLSILSILTLMLLFSINAQTNFSVKLKQLDSLYTISNNFSVEIDYEYYNDIIEKIPEEKISGKLIKNNHNYYYKVGQNEILQNDELTIFIDNEKKVVIISKTQKYNEIDAFKLNALDTLIKAKKIIVQTSVSGDATTYTLTYNQITDLQKSIFTFKGKYLTGIVYYYNRDIFPTDLTKDEHYKPIFKIKYSNYSINMKPLPVSIANVLVRKNNKYHLTKKYSEYKLVNQILQ
jgi:hypothetical protein